MGKEGGRYKMEGERVTDGGQGRGERVRRSKKRGRDEGVRQEVREEGKGKGREEAGGRYE